MAGGKRLMDVEDAVRWACAEELPKKRQGSARTPRLSSFVPRGERTVLGPWTRPAGFPEISPMFARGYASGSGSAGRGGEPDPDALAIEQAILALSVAAGVSAEARAAIAETLRFGIGLTVDCDGALAASFANAANLVLVHGRLGSRPDSGTQSPATRKRLAENGKPGVWRTERLMERTLDGEGVAASYDNPVKPVRRDLYPSGSFCRIEYEPDPQTVINDRADYLAWRMGLDALADALSGRLKAITALATAAALLPWTGETDGGQPKDLFGAGAERVYSGAQAAGMAAERARGARRPLRPGDRRPRRKPAKPMRSQRAT